MLSASRDVVEGFADDVQTLWAGPIPVVDVPPTALLFLRDYVSLSRPVRIRNHHHHASLFRGWTLDQLAAQHPDLVLTVDVTPDGHGDGLRNVAIDGGTGPPHTERVFVQPAQRSLTVSDFRQKLRSQPDDDCTTAATTGTNVHHKIFPAGSRTNEPTESGPPSGRILPERDEAVYYYSRQNDCLRTELASVGESGCTFPPTIPWAEEAFGTGPPAAVNLWMGNARAVSAMHKDHYENLFYVCAGEKIFTLCPPADAPFLYEQPHRHGRFAQESDGRWKVDMVNNNDNNNDDDEEDRIPWIAADVTRQAEDDLAHRAEFPLLKYTHPMQVRVSAGEMLYLPALWFHSVTQSCETVGINYWYEMRFDSPAWCYFHLLQQLRPSPSATADADDDSQSS